MSPLLTISDLHVSYRAVPAVAGASLELHPGELRVILGPNGAGKTTIIKSILGLERAHRGSIVFEGSHELVGRPSHEIHQLGISWVPEGRQLWGTLSVYDNLRMGAFAERDEQAMTRRIGEMFERFPRIAERRDQVAGSLSGGEQQMVAVARALVSGPKLILMDEPSLGLAPLLIRDVFELVREINGSGISILMVEQNARQALKVASWAYLLEVGRIVESGSPEELAKKETVREIYLGGHR